MVGLDDVIVPSTADAVLVTSRTKAEQVKAMVEQLKLHNYRAAAEVTSIAVMIGSDPVSAETSPTIRAIIGDEPERC